VQIDLSILRTWGLATHPQFALAIQGLYGLALDYGLFLDDYRMLRLISLATQTSVRRMPMYKPYDTWEASLVGFQVLVPEVQDIAPEYQSAVRGERASRDRRRERMRSVGRWARTGLVILLGLLAARDVYAWGDIGHQIICEITFHERNS
jgi:hypothetical protein